MSNSSHASLSRSSIPAFLALALLAILVMITRAMSGSWVAAIPALTVWGLLAGLYAGYRFVQGWQPARRHI
jgi:hypothetical protein